MKNMPSQWEPAEFFKSKSARMREVPRTIRTTGWHCASKSLSTSPTLPAPLTTPASLTASRRCSSIRSAVWMSTKTCRRFSTNRCSTLGSRQRHSTCRNTRNWNTWWCRTHTERWPSSATLDHDQVWPLWLWYVVSSCCSFVRRKFNQRWDSPRV